MKYFIIAGEASGDLHGSNLIAELSAFDKNAEIECWGGDLMEKAGGKLLQHYKDIAFMGLFLVLKNIRTLIGLFEKCKNEISNFSPDIVVLIDYPGFNLRMAKFAKQKNFKVVYYISPKIWAWNQKRAWKIKKYVDKMFTILPFETDFYKKYNYSVDFVGNPLLDSVSKFKKLEYDKDFLLNNNIDDKPIIAILPGSRKQEIANALPIMLNLVPLFPEYHFIIAGAPSINTNFYNEFIAEKNIKILFNKTYSILKNADAALVTSGTATLETALFKTPQVVCYKTGWLTYNIGIRLVKVDFFSLVNLILNKEAVTELLQKQFNPDRVKKELSNILYNSDIKTKMLNNYKELENRLGGVGASKRTARKIIDFLHND